TFNMISLIGISISIGLLVDDAIVVVEAIHRRIELGDTPRVAAARGTAEVGPAIFAATAAIIAVFVPIAFMKGMIGRFFYEYGLTVVFAVTVSLVVAVTLTPALGARLMRADEKHGWVFQRLERGFSFLESRYEGLLRMSLGRPFLILGIAGLAVVGALFLAKTIPLEFSSRHDRSDFEAHLELP